MSICLDEIQRGGRHGTSSAPSLPFTQCFRGAQEEILGAPGWLVHDNFDGTGGFREEGPASEKVHDAEGLLAK